MQNSRQIAFLTLRDVHNGAFVDVALDRRLQQFSLSDADRRLVTELVYGCTRRQRTLDAIIDRLGKKNSQSQPKDLRIIFHLGLYQLRYQQRIPVSAAVNTTVELAKANKFAGLSGVVNGVLRQYLRNQTENNITSETRENTNKTDETDQYLLPDGESTPIATRLGILHSFPDWIIATWLDQFGETETTNLAAWMNQTPNLDLRVNPLQTTRDAVQQAFLAAGISSTPLESLPLGLRITDNRAPIPSLPGFEQGWWSVQDASAQLVGYLLNPQPGEVIIDACAAPGGKTIQIAELMGGAGKIWAIDDTPSRLRKLTQNMTRLAKPGLGASQINSIQIHTGDSRNLPQFTEIADRVLLDAPCSGLGTLHRHADARWRQTPERVQQLAQLQTELINHTSTWVKPNGVLVYATCTLHPSENESIIESFLATHPEWQIELPPPPLNPYTTPSGWLKVLPHHHNMDGFFMVRLKKTNNSA